MKLSRIFSELFNAGLILGLSCTYLYAQQVPNHAIPIGRGAGVSGFNSITGTDGQVPVAQTGADPIFKTVGGDCTMAAAGTLTCTKTSGVTLGTMAVQDASSVAITGGTITGMPSPTGSSDVATKAYVDATSTGLLVLSPSRLATVAVLPDSPTYNNGAGTLTAGSNTTLTVDGTLAALNDVILVKDQASSFQNGIYTVTAAGSGGAPWVLTRATYFDVAGEMTAGSYTLITAGSVNAGSAFVLSADVTTVGTDPVIFFPFSLAGTSQWVTSGSDIYFNTGNVSVGTTTPTNTFNVVSNSNADKGTWVENTNAGASATAGIIMKGDAAGQGQIYRGSSTFAGIGGPNGVAIVNTSANPVVIGTNGSERMRIRSTGTVGIGPTAGTGAQLDVGGTIRAVGSTNLTGLQVANSGTLDYATAGLGTRIVSYGADAATKGAVSFLGVSSDGSLVQTYGNFNSSGNFGIGTTSPTTQLHTTGGVRFAGIPGASTAGCVTNDANGVLSGGSACGGTVGVYNVRSYGAAGNGSTNDQPSIMLAVAAAEAAGRGLVYFPCGQYKINAIVSTTNPSIIFGGDGAGCTQILQNNATGGFSIVVTGAMSENGIAGFRDFALICSTGGACGTGLSVTATAAGPNVTTVIVHNVKIKSSTFDATSEKYSTGLYIRNTPNPDIYALEIYQLNSNSGTGIRVEDSNNTGSFPNYGIRLINVHIEAMQFGFRSTGGREGFMFLQPGMYGVNYGIAIDGNGGFGGVSGDAHVVGGSINAKNQTIAIDKMRSVRISSMDLYKGVGFGTDICDSVVNFTGSNFVLLTNNHISSAISLSPCGGFLVNANIVDKFVMSGNSLQGYGGTSPGVKASAGSVLVTLTGNIIDNLGGQRAITAASNFLTCFGNAGGGTGGIDSTGSGNINCSGANNNF